MKFYVALLSLLCASAVFAEEVKAPTEKDCDTLIAEAELTPDTGIYDQCIGDTTTAYQHYGPLASAKNYKKALYEIAVRFPEGEYSTLYMKKSADLGYGRALIQMGNNAVVDGDNDKGITLYKEALQTPDLTPEDKGEISQNMGLIYLKNQQVPADFVKAMEFLKLAADNRQGLANNVLGYYSYTGLNDFPKNDRAALNYFWKGALLGCSVSQENIGAFHLARQKKISRTEASAYMAERLLSCNYTNMNEMSDAEKQARLTLLQQKADCGCKDVLFKVEQAKKYDYLLIQSDGDKATLRDKNGLDTVVQKSSELPDGTKVIELRKTAVILLKNGRRQVINLYPLVCAEICAKPDPVAQPKTKIRPYRFSFTAQECSDILAYASELVDTDKAFVGKFECQKFEQRQEDTTDIYNLITAPQPEGEEQSSEAEKTSGVTKNTESDHNPDKKS